MTDPRKNSSSVQTTSGDIFQELFQRRTGAIRAGLERMESVLKAFPELHPNAPSILIGGTNGKGSTSGFLWQLLKLSDLKVGLYSSPHLVHFAERIQISGELIHDTHLVKLYQELRSVLSEDLYQPLSFFEIATLLAFFAFNQLRTDVNVIEVGLGGRLDATNSIQPDLSIITSIGLDHQEYLGNSLREIASEKCGILRPMRPFFFGGRESCEEEAYKTIYEHAQSLRAPIFELGREIRLDLGNRKIVVNIPILNPAEFKISEFTMGLPHYLLRNFALAVGAAYFLTGSQATIQSAVTNIGSEKIPPTLRGRFEVQKIDGQTYLFDVCHNVHGVREFIKSLRQVLQQSGLEKCAGVVSILKDKDVGGIIANLKEVLSPIVFYQIPNERSMSSETLRTLGLSERVHPDFNSALKEIKAANQELWSEQNVPIVVCGSVAAVGHAMSRLNLKII